MFSFLCGTENTINILQEIRSTDTEHRQTGRLTVRQTDRLTDRPTDFRKLAMHHSSSDERCGWIRKKFSVIVHDDMRSHDLLDKTRDEYNLELIMFFVHFYAFL